ncbi:MAG: hypothetical protein UZ09_BCD002002089 [Bacteroidetes bacterium OLB9]|nr:MAG: hypothetical protein UZ09_BCD002002089 [Bacteroidetes bacterium OLB9]
MKRNKLKLLSGLLLILLIIVGWLALIVINNWKVGGGVIIVVLFSSVISWIWQNMILQKEKIVITEPDLKNVNNYQSDQTAPKVEIPKFEIERKPLIKSFFWLICKLVSFKLAFHKEIINEGNRRLLIIISLFVPFLLSMLYCKFDTEGDYYIDHESFYFAFFWLYFLIHIAVRIYKWVIDGYNFGKKEN